MLILKNNIEKLLKIIHAEKLLVFLFILFLLFTYYNAVTETRFIQDDAYTSLRYVSNFLEGKGLVFNEGERVEGYTNFLWVMILSGTALIVKVIYPSEQLIQILPAITQSLSVIFGFTLLLTTFFLTQKIIPAQKKESITNRIVTFIPAILILYSTPFIYWSVSGMETSLFATLTLLSILFILKFETKKNRIAFVIVSVMNSFLRPEGMIFFFILFGYELVERFFESEEKKIVKRIKKMCSKELMTALAAYLIPLIIYLAFRLVYYGYPFPNTFYAKTEFSVEFLERGFGYFINFTEQYLLFGLLLLPIIIQLLRKQLSKDEKIISRFAFLWSVLVIIIGGDVLPVNRFFLPVMPLIFILLVNSCNKIIDEFLPVKTGAVILPLLSALFIFYAVYNYNRLKPEMMEKRAYESGLVTKMKIYSEFVKQEKTWNNKKRSITVAMSTIGAFSFYSGEKIIDLVGLTDEYTAHHPVETEGIDEQLPVLWKEKHYNAGYAILSKPDFIIFPAGAKPSAFAECAIFVQPEFHKDYYTQIFYSKELQQFLPIFTRKENVRNDSLTCDNSYLKYYIRANNSFLKMLETKNRKLLAGMISDLDAMVKICPERIGEANTLKGMTFSHLGNSIIAEKYLEEACRMDSTNSIAQFYLMNLYRLEGDELKATSLIPKIQRFSPNAFPKLFPN
jgi:arabinofuranosyltransferase